VHRSLTPLKITSKKLMTLLEYLFDHCGIQTTRKQSFLYIFDAQRFIRHVGIRGNLPKQRLLNIYQSYLRSTTAATSTASFKDFCRTVSIWSLPPASYCFSLSIKSIERNVGSFPVYDLTVLESETFTANDIIVHNCSAGIGRTGTFCTVHSLLRKIKYDLEKNPDANMDICKLLKQTVLILRKQRNGMVQTKDQFMFCYAALLGALEEELEKFN